MMVILWNVYQSQQWIDELEMTSESDMASHWGPSCEHRHHDDHENDIFQSAGQLSILLHHAYLTGEHDTDDMVTMICVHFTSLRQAL